MPDTHILVLAGITYYTHVSISPGGVDLRAQIENLKAEVKQLTNALSKTMAELEALEVIRKLKPTQKQ